ncbi:MAG TPA: PIN domain-containing protein [Kofleriaceae bacterium]|nr:PIN domain-containing protein [Kofleriaceae bacterium]
MNVLVDTSVWSLSLRRGAPNNGPVERELAELVREGRVVMIGAVRQELLSGIRTLVHFTKLRDRLRAFDDLPLGMLDYEAAADCFNRCRAKGVQASNTDLLMCAAARSRKLALFTTDADFDRLTKILRVELHGVRATLE